MNNKYLSAFVFVLIADLVQWTDYTDILDGTGSTIVINVPLDDDSAALYARVVKL